jgi:chaperonin GroES
MDDDGRVVEIKPTQYYTKFGAIPNPTGSFYDIGFGHLLGPINESVNTLINQLVDAGSLSNLQSGFLGKGLRVSKGESRFRPGEWKSVNVTGDDIKKHVFALPVREPSNVLFQLLGMLVTSGKELASVAEIMVGKMPGQNTPAYTTKETVEQGMKLFTAIYKRIYRSLKSEFRKLYRLNKQYLDPQEIVDVLDMEIPQSDYEGSENDVIPSADPSAASSSDKFAKVQQIFPLMK